MSYELTRNYGVRVILSLRSLVLALFHLTILCVALPIQVRPPFLMLQQFPQNLVNFPKRTSLRSVPNMSTIGPFPANPSWPTLTIEPRGGDVISYKCHYYSDHFKREDHLRRHELSHGFPYKHCNVGISPPNSAALTPICRGSDAGPIRACLCDSCVSAVSDTRCCFGYTVMRA